MGHIKAYYESIVQLKESEWIFIAARFRKCIFTKNEIITRPGAIERHLSFIEKGIVRTYLPDPNKERTIHFSFDKAFTCAYDSFLTQTPSAYALQSLTTTTAWQISYDQLQEVYTQTRAGNYIGRYASEKLLLAKSKRELSLLNRTAKERYLDLFNEQPEIIRRIPLKYIASYIGVTPQGLSRIRRQIT